MSELSLARASLLVSAFALGAAGAVVVGGLGRSSTPAVATVVVAQAPVTTTTGVAAVPEAAAVQTMPPAPVVTPSQVQPGAAPPAPAADSAFWRLVDETRRAAGNDTARQSELLQERLTQLSPQAIAAFERTRRALDRRAYTWQLWGAAATIEDGCSDDCFRDFRAYVISLGRDVYERAMQDPDSLASVAQNAETGVWENADDVAPEAYSSVTGHDFPDEDRELSGQPAGTPGDQDRATLRSRYPRLAARFPGG